MLTTRFIAFAACALVVGGCGASSKNSNTTSSSSQTNPPVTTSAATVPAPVASIKIASGKSLAHAEWIARGEVICTHVNTIRNANVMKTAQDYARVLPQNAVYDKAEAAELAKLVPPTTKLKDWKRIIQSFNLIGEYTSTIAGYAESNNLESAKSLVPAVERVDAQLESLSKHDGFKNCSVG